MFKTVTNILFLLICFLLLGGGWFLSDASRSENENRALAAFPPVITERGINRSFGTAFEKALVDHLIFRNDLIDMRAFLLNGLNTKGNNRVLIGREGWLFRNAFGDKRNFHNLDSYQRKIILNDAQKTAIANDLKRTLDWARNNGMHVYLIVPPEKPQVYEHYFPAFIKRRNNPPLNRQVAELIPNGLTFIPLEETLKAAVSTAPVPLYWKTDTHWNYGGAFLGYTALMQAIRHDFPDLKFFTRADFDIHLKNDVVECDGKHGGILYKMLRDSAYTDKTEYEFFPLKVLRPTKTTMTENDRCALHRTPNALNDANVMLFHDSYGNYMMDFLKGTFKNLRAVRFNQPGAKWNILLSEEQSDILAFKPDILIFEVSELKLIELTRMWEG